MLAISMPHIGFQSQGIQKNTISTSSTLQIRRPGVIANMRPKLSLQTSSLPITYGGKSSTSLTIPNNILDATTPTVLNTFTNAYDIPIRPSPTASATYKSHSRHTSRASLSSPSSFTTTSSRPHTVGSSGIKSILRNPGGPKIPRRTATFNPNSASPQLHRRSFFPSPAPTRRVKKVSFAPNLTEEIITRDFILRHSDLSASTTSETKSVEERGQKEDTKSTSDDVEEDSATTTTRKRKMDTPSEATDDHARGRALSVDMDTGAWNRSRSRRKMKTKTKRRWEWTLELGVQKQEAEGVTEQQVRDVPETGIVV